MSTGNPNGQVWIAKDKRKIEPVARSSKLYPYVLEDKLGVSVTGIAEGVYRGSYDRIGITISPVITGDLRVPLVILEPLKDRLMLSLSSEISGVLKVVLVSYTPPDIDRDSLQLTLSSAITGTLKRVLVDHPYNTPDNLAITFSPILTGSLL